MASSRPDGTFRVPTLILRLLLAAGPALLLWPAPTAAQAERTVPPPPTGSPVDGRGTAREILQRFVDAWRGPEEMSLADTLVVGFRFTGPGGGELHAVFAPDGGASLQNGIPENVITLHGGMDILRRLDRGELSAMTAMGRAHASDPAPLDFALPEGATFADVQALIPWIFHFWNREWPEVTRFGEGTTRTVHGGNAAILYYDTGLRTAFYQLEPGMHINEAEDQQTNSFPSMFVVIRGEIQARLDGRERRLSAGEAVLVPAGMRHEFQTGPDGYGELIMIAFGEGA